MNPSTHTLEYEVIDEPTGAVDLLDLLADLDTLEEFGDCECHDQEGVSSSFDVFTKHRRLIWAQDLQPFVGEKICLYYQLDQQGQPQTCYWFRVCCEDPGCYRELHQITSIPAIRPITPDERAANTLLLAGLYNHAREHLQSEEPTAFEQVIGDNQAFDAEVSAYLQSMQIDQAEESPDQDRKKG